MSEKTLTPNEIIELYGISRPTLMRWRKSENMPYYIKPNLQVYFIKSEVEAWFQDYSKKRNITVK